MNQNNMNPMNNMPNNNMNQPMNNGYPQNNMGMNNYPNNGMNQMNNYPNNMNRPINNNPVNPKPKMDKKKIFIIIGVVVVVLLVLFYLLGNKSDNNEGGNTNNGGTNTNINTEVSKENVVVTLERTDSKRVYIFAKNNNSAHVELSIDVSFYDEQGNKIDYKPSYGKPEKNAVAPGQELVFDEYDYAPENYATYKIEYKVAASKKTNSYKKVEIVSHETIPDSSVFGESFTVKNTDSTKMDYIYLKVVYYKDGKIVGVGSGTAMSVGASETQTVKVMVPTDRNAHKLAYDDYKLYIDVYNYDF